MVKTMKKFISVLLTLACLTLASCGNTVTGTATGVELTVDNFNDYFDISATVKPGTTTMCMYKSDFVYLYKNLECEISFKGNSNYEFKDVVVEVEFYHTAPLNSEFESKKTIYVNLNLAGNGSGSCTVDTPVQTEEWDNISSTTYTFYSEKNISTTLDYASYSIVGVTGTAIKNS
jgi:hypothetical protein